ncbi:histone-lysine N-methyltransferase 2C [Brachyistius frenatus]|uniref:histone-lysine N-methyltransferase 2C n=1 Tax=Brachyistius frenatus TaxID=100188 RepID=UPI0037E7DB1C
MDCSPSRVPMETEGGGASPMEQSPTLSPHSSPPVSPCLRLEDEDSLSPLFQRSLSEDSGSSPTPSLGHTKKRLKQCAFCYRGDETPLGQGRLVVFGPTPGYIPLHILNRRASSDRDNDCHDHCYRGDQAPPMCSSPEHSEDESSSEFVKQLGPIGLPHDINVQSLFDPTGQCCAHLQCAAWSEGVCRGEGQSLLYVDKAIDSGSTQVCAFCRRFGASLRCQETGCRRSYHFPCAAAAGAHQDWNQRHTLCTRHTHPDSAQCVSCLGGVEVGSLLMCCCCGNRYHGSCLDPSLAPSPQCRVGWQCSQCRVCQSCRLRGDDDVLLVCEHCDKAYHTHCLAPPLDHTPSTGWTCKNCRVCRHCGVTSSGQWANHPFLCRSCDQALPCPLCGHTPDLYTPQEYLTCTCCFRCVHAECIVQYGEGRAGSEGYICSNCRPQEKELTPHSPALAPPLGLTTAPTISISQPPIPPISPIVHSPVQLVCSELPQSPSKTICAPSEQSLTPTHPEHQQRSAPSPTEPQTSPAPSPTEPQTSPAPSPTEPQTSPAPSPTDLRLSPAPSSTEPQPIPAPSPPEPQPSPAPSPTDLQPSPAPSPTVLQPSPAPSPTDLQPSPAPSPTEPQPIPAPSPTEPQPSPAPCPTDLQPSPAPCPTDLQPSPAPCPTDLQLSPAPCPTDLQPSPAPSPTEPQPSPAPSPTDPQPSPAPSPTEPQPSPAPSPTEPQPSPAPSPTEPQPSPAPSPTEPQPSPAPSPTESQSSPAPSPTESQPSPAPSPADLQPSPAPSPADLQPSPAPSPADLQPSPAPSPADLQPSPAPTPTESQSSPAPSPTEPQPSPAPSSTDLQPSPAPSPTEPQPSPAPSLTDLQPSPASSPTEPQSSPAPTPTEPQSSPAPSPTEPQPSPAPSSTDLQPSPAPSPTEPQPSPAPSLTDLQPSPASSPTALKPSPAPTPTEPQSSPAPTPTELQSSPAPSPTDLQPSPAPSPTDLQPSPAPSPTEPQPSPAPSPTDPQPSPAPSRSDPTELQKSPSPCHPDSTEHQESRNASHPSPVKLQQSPTQSHSGQTELEKSPWSSPPGPTELHHSPTHVISTQTQLILTSSNPTQHSTEDQQSQKQSNPMSCILADNPPPRSLSQPGHGCSWVQTRPAEHQHSPPPLSHGQDASTGTQLNRLPSPTNIVISQPQHSPSPGAHSPMPHSPAQVGTSPPQSPTQDAEPTLDQESPGSSSPAHLRCEAAKDISTLDQDLSLVCWRSNKTVTRHSSLRTISAPCSPSPSPPGPRQCSLSQPASPAQALATQAVRPLQLSLLPLVLAVESTGTKECTLTTELNSLELSLMQPGPDPDGQTLESSPASLSPTCDLSTVHSESYSTYSRTLSSDHFQPPINPAVQTRESLVHVSPSVEHSSLTSSPCADGKEENTPASHNPQSPCDSTPCTDAIEKACPVHIQASSASASPTRESQMPTSPATSLQICGSPIPVETSSVHVNSIVADTSPSTEPVSPVTLTASGSMQPISSSAPLVRTSAGPGSPSAVLAGPIHSVSCQDEETEVAVDHASHFIEPESSTSHPDSPVHTSPTIGSLVHTEATRGCGLTGSVHVVSPSVCSFAELEETQTSPTHPSSPSNVRTPCIPSQTSPPPTPASSSPPHCTLADMSPSSSSVSHSLSNVTSDCQAQMSLYCASVTDGGVVSSPSRSSPAGQASPVQVVVSQSIPVQTQTPSCASSVYRSPAHAAVACVSPPHSLASASETYHSPHRGSASDTGTSTGLKGAQPSPILTSSSLDVDMVASPIIQSSVLSGAVQLDTGLINSTDCIRQTIPTPTSPKPDDSSPVSPNQASLNQVSQSPPGLHSSPDRSSVESQLSTASLSPSYRRQDAPVDATSTRVRPSHASSVHASPTQDNTVMPSTSHTKETPASTTCSAPSQVSPPQTVFGQASFVLSSPVASPVFGPKDSEPTPSPSPCPGPASPHFGPARSVQPEASLSSGSASLMRCGPGPDSQMPCEVSPGGDPVSPALGTLGRSETSSSPGPAGAVQPGPSSGSHFDADLQQYTLERESAATLDVSMAEEQGKTEEEGEAPQQEEEVEEREKPHQSTQESPEEEDPVDRTEGGRGELNQEEEDQYSNCRSGVQLTEQQQSPPHTAAASPFLPQPAPPCPLSNIPCSALPPQMPSSSPSSSSAVSPVPSPQSPPQPPPRAGSLEASPSSSPHRTALSPSSPQTLPPLLEDRPLEEEPTSQREAKNGKEQEVGLKDKTYFCPVTSAEDDSQSQSLFKPVALATTPTKDKHQSHTEPSDKEVEEEHPVIPEPAASDMLAACPVVTGQHPLSEKRDTEDEDQSDLEEEEDPVSPVLDLDPSLDMEVMELMTSSPPPSLLHLSSPSPPAPSHRGKSRTLRPPPCSSRPSDDLSIRLRQSPFSTEASPETSPARAPVTPPPLSPPSPPLRSSPPARESPPLSKTPPTTVLLFAPKIGMGKPAISKRKFSPGRARVKQGSWWSNRRAVSPPSSSQDSTGEGGWDSPKARPPDSPLWSMRVGRGSGFPGRRRSRGGGVGGGRGGRGRSRLKTQDSLTVSPGCVYVEPFQAKEEEENSMHNTVVMFSTSDHFTLRQDMCVVCGSFGQGAEGRLLACSQCGQCYHPYCVNVKITRVVLTKGWRCLECTVCEACGEASDPGRLLLCDDCDISYHTYCLDPPLHTVPKGAWKCKWCVWCVQCGSASPGLHCDWQSNYSLCGPCCSLSRCPLCQRAFAQDDLILQCQQCDRWVHAVCQGLTTEDEVEVAADEGFDCSLCRTHGSCGRSDSVGPYMAQIISRIREPDAKTYTQDGVCLTESGLSQLQSLVEPLTSPRRYRRCKPKLKLRIINQNSVSVLQTPDPETPNEQDHGRGDLECDMKSDSSPERDHAHDYDVTKEAEVIDGNKKRKRKPYRPGIGGFMVRQRGGKSGPSRIKLCRKDSTETLPGLDEGPLDADVAMETAPPIDQPMEKVKKRYRKKKTKLEEAFPSYLQDAFFGRDLLDRSRQVDRRAGPEAPGGSQSGATTADVKGPAPGLQVPSPSVLRVGAMATSANRKQLPLSEDALVDLSDVLNTDPHILATGPAGQFQVERSPSPFAGLDISSMADDSLTSEPTGSGGGCGQRTVQEEPLDAILSPELDKMVTDGAILSKLYKIPELEGKDVEEVFTAVLSPNRSNNQPEQQHTHTAAGSKTHTTAAVFPRLPLMNGLMSAAPHLPNTTMMPGGAQGPAGFRMPPPESHAPTPVQGHAPAQTSTNQTSAGEGEQDALSTAQRSMLKWEKEESLGDMATVAPVLYCNTNFPQLRHQYPEWSTRVKQIAKLWRKASSQDRSPYVQKARDNRAAQRINKVQLSNEPLKRPAPSQQQQQPPVLPPPPPPPPPGPYDPVTMETDLAFKDPLRPKETEQEQEWKFRQQMRQKSKQLAKMEATQKLEQVKIEQLQQRQQHLSGHLSPEAGSPTHVAGGNTSPLQSRQHLLLQDDVFLRPQAPPPSGFSSLPHSPHPSSPLHQPPSSPQMFSPPSSRPSSPWDPYSKVVGTPRPPSSQPGGPAAPPAPQQQQRHHSLSASPAHDAMGSPAPSPDPKPSDVSRLIGPQTGLQASRPGMMSPSSPSTSDLSVRHGVRAAESFQRNLRAAVLEPYGRVGEAGQGGLFKAPMPPQQPQQEVLVGGGGGGGRRDPTRTTDLGFSLSQDPSFPSSPRSGLGSPHRSPYSQQIADPFSPLTSRPSPDPYAASQTQGTPRPHADPSYLPNPPALRLDQYQQSVARRPSPSHLTVDPYASAPGTPRPSVAERFPRSPGSQRSSDLYAQQPSTSRPHKVHEPFSQSPAEGFPPQPGGPGSSPLGPGLSGDPVNFTPTPHQQSPGRQPLLHDSFPRTPGGQTPKHPGISEESGFSGLASRTPNHDPFEHSHLIPDKMAASDMSALGGASLDGPMSLLPQLGDSEEKLRQRQRLRQLILRQQQQKSALRQEKGLQEPGSGPAVPPAAPPGPPASATPLHSWSQEESSTSTAPPADPFGRPPPPYPGTVRPNGPPAPRFAGEAPFPRQNLHRELGVRGPALRFGGPPAAPLGLQDSFLCPAQGALPVSGLSALEGVQVQMRRPGEFTAIRPLTAPGAHLHMMPGVPQPFLPRSLPIQQHSIMGQPYIELRHRSPENRLRLPFPLPASPDHNAPLQPSAVRPGPGVRMGETLMGQQVVMQMQHLGHPAALTQSGMAVLPGSDGMEEHLEGEDSAVKDLEDVEVKDLVDLNLNLDPEDGKEDLDLGPNDLHLDDFLLSGKFDLIAYADPELNLEDKKDMFNEELDLGEPVEDKGGGDRKADGHAHLVSQVKQEVKDGIKTEGGPPGPPGLPGSSVLLPEEKLEDSGSGSGAGPALQAQEQVAVSGLAPRVHPSMAAGQQSVFQQRPFGPSPSSSSLLTPRPQGLVVSPHPSLNPQGPPAQPHLLLTPQIQNQMQNQVQNQIQIQIQNRLLLLEEQPLLLQDLLDQERQEQQQQKQMQNLIRHKSTSDPVFPDIDFDSDPIMKAKMVALQGINKVMTQSSLGLNPMVINRFQQAPEAPVPEATPQAPHLVGQDKKLTPQLVRPNPPGCGPAFVNESQRRQYEEWLGETQQLLQMQQRLLDEQIAAHRKTKKALSAKQRTAKRAGRALAEEDAAQLRHISEQQGAVQKQLEQIRKQQKDHAELIEDYRTKQQQRALQQQPAAPLIPTPAPSLPQNLLSQQVPLQSHTGGPTPARVTNFPPGWTPGGGAPVVMGQRMPPQMPPALTNAPQGPPLTQTPPAMVPRPNGAAGDASASTPQVKFDDNNPFSDCFQERERRERLREQQERQRVQLMQEVERHRALQQRLELEQQGLLGASVVPGSGVAAMPPAGALSGAGVGQTPGPAPAPGGDSLSQMPFFSSELPQDFLQTSPPSRPPPQHQGQAGAPYPQQAGLHQGFTGGALLPGAHPVPVLLPGTAAERGRSQAEHRPPMDVLLSNLQTRPRLPGPVGPSVQGQVRLTGIGAAAMTPSHPGGHRFGHDSSSSSPLTSLAPSFPCPSSGGPASLIQLYSDIIPDDKPKKRRSRKKDGDEAVGGGARTPLSSHSDDITAPPTPVLSDTCSTPPRVSLDQPDVSFHQSSSLSGLAPSTELERQLSVCSATQQRASVLGMEGQRGPLSAVCLEVKEEREEGGACGGGVVKMEEGEGFSPLLGGDGGKELLRHLLKDKTSPATTPSPTGLALPTARHQLSNDGVRSDEEDGPGSHGNMVSDPDLKKTQRCKRPARPDKDRAPPKNKRRKREEEEKTLHSSTSSDPLMTHLRQLSVLPLMEPVLGVDLGLFPPYGSSSLGRDSRLSGSFGNACLDGVTDYYSQLIYKNNLSNPPTPPASLPPTPPPVARQKLVNGFATTEELTRNDISEQDGKGVLALKHKGEELLALNHASKTVDVPASLPTPPHNNQEELRVQDSSQRGSPDGFVPSSSPESVADMEVSRYPDLSFIKLEPPSPCPSPPLPIMPCAWGKGSAVKQEVKAEPNRQAPPSCSNTDLVTIAITLNPVAAQNVAGVMAAVAALLRVPVPVDYQLSQATGPEPNSLALLAGVRVPLTTGPGPGSRPPRPAAGVRMDIQHGGAAAPVRAQFCSHCKVLLGNGVHIVKELKQEGQSRPGSSLVFCSPNCSALHTSDLQNRIAASKTVGPVLPPPSRVQHQYTNNMSSIGVQSLPPTPPSPHPAPTPSSSSSPPLSFPTASAITMETRPRMDSLKVKVKLKPHPRAVPGGEDLLSSRHGKRMKSCRWRRWSISISLSRGPCIPNEAVGMPTEDEVDVLLKKLGVCLRPDPLPKDQRRCCFCHQQGDGRTDGPARLLNLDLDLWVHLNCALWSSEVYETQAGALINVEPALRRGLSLRCAHCQQTGATSGCNRLRCTNTYHFTCALTAHCTFFKDKTMLCHLHKPRMVSLGGDRSSSGSPSSTSGATFDPVAVCDPYDCELRCFAVFRRVFVQRDEARQIAAVVQRGDRQHTFRVGSLLFRAVGRLLPQQMNHFHNEAAIFPIGYHANRIYWSMRHSNRRCKYMCYIEEEEGRPLFKVKVVEKGHDDLILTGPSPKAVWDQILDPVSQIRSSTGTLKLFPVYLKGEDLFGLTSSAVTRIIESLPGVEACDRYTFRYGRNPLMEWPLAFNPSGSARSEPKACQIKRTSLLTSVAPRCQGSVGSIVGLVPGVISLSPGETVAGAHQGRHSKSSQYRRMKAEWKSNVYLARSGIQGLGLYAAKDIERCTMVIEYIGTIIRSEVANRKERLYESQNRGVYMFRIDNDYVIDATITGGPARYINHSCGPNCITEVVTVEKENKIIISSCRRIQRGEELCYDYKFDLEDDQHKIPCHCGAVNCRKWMN